MAEIQTIPLGESLEVSGTMTETETRRALKKVSVIDYDKKDCDLVVCPQCQSSNFSVVSIRSKKTGAEHFHLRCVLCDLTWCAE